MDIQFTKHAWEEFEYFLEKEPDTASKIRELIKVIRKTPFLGIGKPEPLKFGLSGCWSRRINLEHRLVYRITGEKGKDQKCTIIQCKYHY